MAIEIGSSKPRPIDFTFNGKSLAVRKLPLSLGLKMQMVDDNTQLPSELVAEIIAKCVIYEKDKKAVWTVDDVLEFDLEPMLQLFSEISGVRAEDAEKN